jgi:membrane-bound lytic murein transglycosylase F
MTTAYDEQFRLQTAIYFGDTSIDGQPIDWRWFKAQAMAESGLDPKAISRHSARGIMQMMPPTFAECKRELSLPDADPFDPLVGIKFGIYYDWKMWRIWAKENGLERLRFMFAAYNAGAGNIIKAQRLASPTHLWWAVAKELPRITGRGNARETEQYVKRIEAFHRQLCGTSRGQE